MASWLVVTLLLGQLAPAPKRWSETPAEKRNVVLANAQSTASLAERLALHSARFLNTPYIHSPLGEGKGQRPDSDPAFRYDAVDCLTFVETTIALALSNDEAEAQTILSQLRYRERPSYDQRNHLMEAQWLPTNAQKGFIKDVTADYAASKTLHWSKKVEAQTWQSNSARSLGLAKAAQTQGEFFFDAVTLDNALEIAAKVPSGTLMMVVREEAAHKITRMTHLGFVFHQGDRVILRHASRDPFGRVVDEELSKFIRRNSRYDKWRVAGVSFWSVLDAKPSDAQPQAIAPNP
jgi:hypothetical protein